MKHPLLHLAALALAAFGASAHAAIYTVGSGADCTHGTIQSAINAANSHPGADVIRLTRSLTYEPESNTINTSDDLSIVGGFATCAQAASDGIHTVVSGLGASGSAVFAITANGSAIVKLRHLDIKNGKTGISFSGNGILQTIETTITRNTSVGIAASTTGNTAELVIDTGTLVIDNGTSECLFLDLPFGGGIRLEGAIEMTMTAPQTMIGLNSACKGGGLYVGSGAYAYIGSPGYSGLPAIYQNDAAGDGGGAFVLGTLKLFTTDSAHPTTLGHNEAERNGGGVFVGGANSRLCGWDFAIDDNTAQGLGGAIHGEGGSTIVLNRDDNALCTPHPEAVRCALGTTCSSISGNAARGGDAGVVELSSSLLDSKRVRMRRNEAAFAVHGLDSDVRLNACLIADNTISKRLLDTYGAATANSLFVDSCTLARNTIGEAVIYTTRKTWLTNDIIDQPNNVVADIGPNDVYVANLLVTSTGGLPASPSIVLGNPMFVDAAHGDYHVNLTSPAIDFAAADTSFSDIDLDGDPRNVDLPGVPNRYGPRDLGAYEWNPLIRNGWFDANLSSWTHFDGAWDGAQNAAGNAGSGSWKMLRDVTPPIGIQPMQSGPGDYSVGEQCVRLPASGSYLLNGWGKGGGNMIFRDSAVLAWEYRKNGGADCSGTPDASSEMTLGSSAAWTRPAQSAVIQVPAADFHANGTTLKVRLLMRTTAAAGVRSAWFDGLTLERSDVIFANGFD